MALLSHSVHRMDSFLGGKITLLLFRMRLLSVDFCFISYRIWKVHRCNGLSMTLTSEYIQRIFIFFFSSLGVGDSILECIFSSPLKTM